VSPNSAFDFPLRTPCIPFLLTAPTPSPSPTTVAQQKPTPPLPRLAQTLPPPQLLRLFWTRRRPQPFIPSTRRVTEFKPDPTVSPRLSSPSSPMIAGDPYTPSLIVPHLMPFSYPASRFGIQPPSRLTSNLESQPTSFRPGFPGLGGF